MRRIGAKISLLSGLIFFVGGCTAKFSMQADEGAMGMIGDAAKDVAGSPIVKWLVGGVLGATGFGGIATLWGVRKHGQASELRGRETGWDQRELASKNSAHDRT